MALVTNSFVIAETATVLSHRQGQKLARIFLDIIEAGHLPVIYITEPLYEASLAIFRQQNQRGTSVTDCINVALCRYLNISSIFSFDRVYSNRFDLRLAGKMLAEGNVSE